MHRILRAVVALIGVLALAACSSPTAPPVEDSPRDGALGKSERYELAPVDDGDSGGGGSGPAPEEQPAEEEEDPRPGRGRGRNNQ